jgi:hypothetical protein
LGKLKAERSKDVEKRIENGNTHFQLNQLVLWGQLFEYFQDLWTGSPIISIYRKGKSMGFGSL